MPELPDLTVYVEHLNERVRGHRLTGIRLTSPFLLRTVSPGIDELSDHEVVGASRLAKQIVIELADEFFAVLHLMIAGRLRWYAAGKAVPKRNGLAAFDFATGSMILTEASKKKRASLRLIQGRPALAALDPGGLEIFDIDGDTFFACLRATPHTLKRALTDQRVFAGIGNAYSDEILFRAGISPFKQGKHLTDAEAHKLFAACRDVLTEWTARLREEAGAAFPDKVTAFSTTQWRSTANTNIRARSAGRLCSASSIPTTRPTTAPPVRPAASCSPTVPCRACSRTPTPSASKTWRARHPPRA